MSLEHVGSPLEPSYFIDDKTVKVATSRSVASDARSDDDDLMEGLSVADVLKQFGVDPNAVLSSDGVLRSPEGLEYDNLSSGSSEKRPADSSSSSCESDASSAFQTEVVSRSSTQESKGDGSASRKIEKLRYLRSKLTCQD